MQNMIIAFREVAPDEIPSFVKDLQSAFSVAVIENFGSDEIVPPDEDILSSVRAEDAETYHIVADGKIAGGVVLRIDNETNVNYLDLFFIRTDCHDKGIGLAAWKAIEKRYSSTVKWRTITPYFEQRNIHFYVNKCGFKIIEFFNSRHKDPDMPASQTGDPAQETYFLFEKEMK